MKAIVCYLSYSGNTEEVAELIKGQLVDSGYVVDMYLIGFGTVPDLSTYDIVIFWDVHVG